MRGGEQDPAVGGQRLEGAAFVGSEAVDLGAVGDKATHTGAARHPDVDQLVGNHPARHQHLLVDVDGQLRRLQAGIWRTQGRALVLPLHHQRTRIEREQLAGLHVAHNFHAVGHKGGEIVQAGGEHQVVHQRPVFEVANAHDAAGRAVAYGDLTETIGQRRHVARAQFQVARIHPSGIVVAQAGLPCPAYAVVLCVVHGAHGQGAGGVDLVVAGGEVDVVGHNAEVATGAGGDHARGQRELGFTGLQGQVNGALGGVQAAVAAPAADDAQVVGLAQHNGFVSGCTGRASVDHRQLGQIGVQCAANARCGHVVVGPWRHQLGAVGGHIQQARHVQQQIGLTPAGGRIRAVKTRLNQGLRGQVVEHHQLQRITEVHAALFAAHRVDHQLVVVELQRSGRAEVVQHHPVIASAAVNLGSPGQGQGDEVVSFAGIDRVKTACQANLVVALAA